MPFTIQDEKQYPVEVTAVYQAACAAVSGIEGKTHVQDEFARNIFVRFDKKILGYDLAERTEMNITITAPNGQGSRVAVEIYPLNAIGQKLMFGARKGVSRTVADWFFAHLEHRLPK